MEASSDDVHVVWQDFRDGNWEIYYKRDPTGNPFGIQIISSKIPKEFKLGQNYPNPFNPKTIINFFIGSSGQLPPSNLGFIHVSLKIYDLLGREVVTLVNEELNPGTYAVDWDALNFPSGIYFYSLHAGDYKETKEIA
jgi:hypothetical protein